MQLLEKHDLNLNLTIFLRQMLQPSSFVRFFQSVVLFKTFYQFSNKFNELVVFQYYSYN